MGMQTTWLLTGKQRNKTGRVGRIYKFQNGCLQLNASDARAQLIDNQVVRYHGAVRVGTPAYYRKLQEHFAPDPSKPGGYRGQILNEDHIPEEHRLAAQSSAKAASHSEALPPGPSLPVLPAQVPGTEHAQAGEGGQAHPAAGGDVEGAPDLPAPAPSPHEALKTAVLGLDPDKEAFWTDSGEPLLDVVKGLVGREVTRDEVHAVAPGHNRETARLMKTLEG